jgi:hypothetical protein
MYSRECLTFLKPKLNTFSELYFCNTKITFEILKNQQTCDMLTTWLFVISVPYKKNLRLWISFLFATTCGLKFFPFCILFFYRALFIWNTFTEGTVVHFPWCMHCNANAISSFVQQKTSHHNWPLRNMMYSWVRFVLHCKRNYFNIWPTFLALWISYFHMHCEMISTVVKDAQQPTCHFFLPLMSKFPFHWPVVGYDDINILL